MKHSLLAGVLALALTGQASADVLFSDDFNGNQVSAYGSLGYWFGASAKGGPPQGMLSGGELLVGFRHNNTSSDWSWDTGSLVNHDFTDAAITQGGGFRLAFDVTGIEAVNPLVGALIGTTLGPDPQNWWPFLNAALYVKASGTDLTVHPRGGSDYTVPLGKSADQVGHIDVEVHLTSFSDGAPATADVTVDGVQLVSGYAFTWSGNVNYLGVYGGGGTGSNGEGVRYAHVDNLLIESLGTGGGGAPAEATYLFRRSVPGLRAQP